jgi:hypothetical protein
VRRDHFKEEKPKKPKKKKKKPLPKNTLDPNAPEANDEAADLDISPEGKQAKDASAKKRVSQVPSHLSSAGPRMLK